MVTLALALTLLLPQSGTPASNPVLEGVAVQAGEALVMLSELERATQRVRERNPPGNREEELRQRLAILRDLWTLRLEEQAGADLDLDPSQLGRHARANLEAERERVGLEAYLDELRSQGKDALSEERDHEQQLLGLFWRQKALGRSFAAKRATRDESIRPGELRSLYEENKDRLAPVTVQLRWLVVSSAAMGGPEAARASCEDARARVLAGEDLALLVLERGVEFRDTRGLTPFVPPRAIPDPAVRAFALEADVAELSEVLPLTSPKTGEPDPSLGFQLVELHERRTPPQPEFSSPEVQRRLREVFSELRAERILGRAREELHRQAYAWVNPLIRTPVPASGP
jgi:hypothetical protein